MRGLTVSRLFVYPIKSLGGMELDAAEVEARGFRHDRRWMLVDGDGVFLSQRRHPRMALARARVEDERLVVDAPGMPALELPLRPEPGPAVRACVWGDEVEAVSCGGDADLWFAEFLGASCRLVHMPDETERAVDPLYAGAADRVGFADGFPFLLLSEASLDDLNARLDSPLPVNRYRPNIVVAGCVPYEEDRWRRVRIGDVGFRVVKPCSRCAITIVNQETGEKGKEPLRTLAAYRKVGGKVFFGQNAIPDGAGRLRVGDAVEVGSQI
jgi:uncharacterized protein YcbX